MCKNVIEIYTCDHTREKKKTIYCSCRRCVIKADSNTGGKRYIMIIPTTHGFIYHNSFNRRKNTLRGIVPRLLDKRYSARVASLHSREFGIPQSTQCFYSKEEAAELRESKKNGHKDTWMRTCRYRKCVIEFNNFCIHESRVSLSLPESPVLFITLKILRTHYYIYIHLRSNILPEFPRCVT